MNIWALKKDITIKHLLLLLSDELGPATFVIADPEGVDERAVRLCHADDDGIAAYVYTYGQAAEHYGVHLEYPLLPDNAMNNLVEEYDDIGFDRLAAMLAAHFAVGPAGTTD